MRTATGPTEARGRTATGPNEARGRLAAAPAAHFRLPAARSELFAREERELLMEHVRALLGEPTAPYAEDAQVNAIRRFAAARADVELREDEHSNLVLTRRGAMDAKSRASGRAPRGSVRSGGSRPNGAPSDEATPRTLAFSAHLDHPGFLYRGEEQGRHVAQFHGGVPLDHFRSAPVRFFALGTSDAIATARVRAVAVTPDGDLVAELERFAGRAERGMFGTFDLTPGTVRGRRLHARACDDLMGAAAILATFDLLARRGHDAGLTGIFTRAEETGFVGCQALLRSGLLTGDVVVVGLECSPKRATAKVGQGPVIRVGDRQSVFDPRLTSALEDAAARVRARHPEFRFQRALMDGGSCESTAYNLWKVPAGGMCLALGNYHNCGSERSIAPEYVDWDDFEGLVASMLECTVGWTDAGESPRMLERMDRIWKREQDRLAESSRRMRAGSRS